MDPTIFETRFFRPQDQFDAWREWFSPVFDVTSCQPVRDGFFAENKVWNLGDLSISRLFAPSLLSVRKKANLAKAPIDHWVLTYWRQGESNLQTAGETLQVRPGALFFWSMGEDYECERSSPVDRIQIIMPRDAFHDIVSQLDAARGTMLDTPLGGLLRDYMVALERWLPFVEAKDISRLQTAIRGMIAACVAPSADRLALAKSEIARGRMERVRQAVHKHLRSPALGPDMLCRIAGISRTQLYRLFEHTGGVAHYIQRRRLQCAYAILSDPVNHPPIATVAQELCFADASSFSRAFRKEFGYSPSDVRHAAVASKPLVAPHLSHKGLEAARFGDLVRGF